MTHLTGFPCPLARRGSRRDAAHRKRAATCAERSRETGLRWGAAARRVRCDPWRMRVHRAAGRACPARRRAAIKWVIINAPWYQLPPVRRSNHSGWFGENTSSSPFCASADRSWSVDPT